jgi:hypothetical protein
MFDLILGLRQAVKEGMQYEDEITGSRPLFRAFWVLGSCKGYGKVGPWVYPCLGPLCNIYIEKLGDVENSSDQSM